MTKIICRQAHGRYDCDRCFAGFFECFATFCKCNKFEWDSNPFGRESYGEAPKDSPRLLDVNDGASLRDWPGTESTDSASLDVHQQSNFNSAKKNAEAHMRAVVATMIGTITRAVEELLQD